MQLRRPHPAAPGNRRGAATPRRRLRTTRPPARREPSGTARVPSHLASLLSYQGPERGGSRAGPADGEGLNSRRAGRASQEERRAMLTKEDNELVSRVGPGTLMGNLMRQYWIPALLSSEL